MSIILEPGTIPILCPMQGRSPGLHVSGLISEMAVSMGHYPARDGPPDDAARVKMELGNCWEYALIKRWQMDEPGRYREPGELMLDGIAGTPDLFDHVDNKIIEIKCTWMSARHEIDGPKFWSYWTQIGAYCMMAGVILSQLHVVHVRGNYKTGEVPVYNRWTREWSQQELAENWAMLKVVGRSKV